MAKNLNLHPPVTIPIAFVHGMMSGVKGHQVLGDTCLADAGIARELLLQPAARVTSDQYVTLFRLLIERLDDDALGLLSRPFKRGSFALVARSAIGATTLEVAMRRIAHTFRLLQDDVVLESLRDGAATGLGLRFTNASGVQPPFLHEMLLRVFWRLLAWLAGGHLHATRFDFAFEQPSYAGRYGKVFPAPLNFGQRRSAVWFDLDRLKDPVRRDEAALRTFLADAQTHVVVPRRGDHEVSMRVRSHLQNTQPAWPDLGATAEALHLTTATLQRRLAGEGTSFQALKDDLRRDMAIVRLSTSAVSLGELAYDMGFADSATFQRAFKAWTGSAPGSYRAGAPSDST